MQLSPGLFDHFNLIASCHFSKCAARLKSPPAHPDTSHLFFCKSIGKLKHNSCVLIGNPFGMGFLYIRRSLAQSLEPMYYSYFNLKTPQRFPDYISYLEDPSRNPFDDCDVYQDATKFEICAYTNYWAHWDLQSASGAAG